MASAGSAPKPSHPDTVKVLAERRIDIAARRSKSFVEFDGQHFDYIVTLCDKVRERCPEFPAYPRFQRTAIELETRISLSDPDHRQRTHHEEYSKMNPELVSVRYLVDDVDTALDFYTSHLGFEELSNAAPRSQTSCGATYGCYSAARRAQLADRCPMVASRRREAGTGSTSSSTTSRAR